MLQEKAPIIANIMKTTTVYTTIDETGTLRLEVPMELPPGPAEVVVVVRPQAQESPGPTRARSGVFSSRSADALDTDAAIEEMNLAWKSKL
jgi:hypothetical protein